MTILTTANYAIPYTDDQTAIADLATVMQQLAARLDTLLGQGGYTPTDATSFAALAARVTSNENRLTPLETKTTPAYVTPTFANGFAQFTTAPFGEKVRAVKTPLGDVNLRGMLSVPVRGNTNSVVGLTLPVGYRPAVQVTRYAILNGSTGAAPTIWRADILTTGDVQFQPAATTAAVGFTPLDWTFRTVEPA